MRTVAEVAEDVWTRILEHSELADVLSLEQTCTTLRKLVKNRTLWLSLLQDLEATEPPSIPPHVPLSSLQYLQLRSLATSAHRRDLVWESSSQLSLLDEVIIPYGSASLGEDFDPSEFSPQLFVLPGGEYVLSMWPEVEGYLSCWSIPDKKWLWSYPPPERRGMALNNFAYDMKENGDIHFVFVDDNATDPRTVIESCHLYVYNNSSKVLSHNRKIVSLDFTFGLAAIVKLKDDVSVIYQKFGGILTFNFSGERRLVVSGANLDCIELAYGYLFGISSSQLGDKTLFTISLSDAERLAFTRSDIPQVLTLSDIIFCSKPLRPQYKSMQKAMLTLNTIHWKRRSEQDKVFVTVFVPFKNILPAEMEAPASTFTFYKDSKRSTQDRLVLNNHLVMDYPTSNNEPLFYFPLAEPTLSGHILCLVCNNDSEDAGEGNSLALAKPNSRGAMVFKNLGVQERKVRYRVDGYVVSMDVYSGTIAISVDDHEGILIQRYE